MKALQSERLCIRLTEVERNALEIRATAEGVAMTDVIRKFVRTLIHQPGTQFSKPKRRAK